MQQFYTWFERLGEDTVTEEKYSSTIETLKIYRDYSSKILSEIEEALSYLENLENNYNLVSKKTSELHDACEVLVNQQNQLLRLADVIDKKLTYFNELPKITQKLSTSTISVYDDNFKTLLAKLDDCIQFTSLNRDFMDSEVYLVKYKQLQSRALSLIKNEIISTIRNITNQIQSEIKSKGTSTNDAANIEKLYYIKFRSVAQKLKPLSEEIEKRREFSKEYQLLLEDCHNCYFVQRQILLNSIINSNVALVCRQSNDLCIMARNGCIYLLGVCHNEFQLYQHFFNTPTTTLTYLLEGFSSSLYESFRPIFIRSHNIEMLCSLVYMLKTEIINEQLVTRGKSVEAFKPIVDRMLQDVQERLTFLAQTYIRDEITSYLPLPEDLNYPEKLSETDTTSSSNNNNSNTMMPFKSLYRTWYPTLERTLVCLSKLYLTVPTQIFEGLATEAIGECTATLVSASKLIATKKSPTDGLLFLIRHLLTLREQITPFDATFSITEHSLDFSHMKDAFRRILTSRSELFSFTGSNPFVGVVQNAVPNVETSQVDSRKDLEKELKSAVEAYINSVTKTVTESLLSFLTKATAFLNVKGARNQVVNQQDLLRTQVFASPDRVKQVLDDVQKRVEETLPQTLSQMRIYISSVSTQNLLYRPIKDQIMESLKQLASLVNSQYLPEDRSTIDLSVIDFIHQKLESYVVVSRERDSTILFENGNHPK